MCVPYVVGNNCHPMVATINSGSGTQQVMAQFFILTPVTRAMQILSFDVDLLSLIPAVFATLLSIYNWWTAQKAADIHAGDVISYGHIASDYHGGTQLLIPVLLHNEAPNMGLVTGIAIKIRSHLEVLGRVRMRELDINQVFNFDWDSFEKDGYTVILPTYPIPVEGYSSVNVNLICQTEELPVDQEVQMEIEVSFGRDKRNTTRFPFFLSSERADIDNQLQWLHPVERSSDN